MKRRSFLKAMGGTAGSAAMLAAASQTLAEVRAGEPVVRVQGMPRRRLGRTGWDVSIIGFPGLALAQQDQAAGTRALHQAYDNGINYFDVAPAYGKDGDAEIKMGVGLQGLERSKYFLACKTKMRDAQGAREELERSLKRLKTDYFDLYQLHHIVSEKQVEQALGPGGAMETLLKAREQGKVRYFGFSAHTTKGALALMKGYGFDTVMFPINFVEYFTRGFGRDVLALASEQGAAVLSIKCMSRGTWAREEERTRQWWYRSVETPREVDLAIRFALSLKGVVTGFPPSFLDLVDKAVVAARGYRELTVPEMNDLVQIAWNCGSLFKQEEEQATAQIPYPHHPHDFGPYHHA